MPGGRAVNGYRAPSFSIDARTPWAHRVLAEQGYAYSSSVAPIRHDHYGWRESPRFAWRPVAGADLIELPVTTVELAGRRLAAGGGGFFRLLPYRFLELGDRPGQPRRRSGRPSSISIPGRSIPDQPRVAGRAAQVAASPLHQSLGDAAQAAEIAQAIIAGAGPTRWPRPSGRGWHERARRHRPLAVRAADLRDPANAPGSTPSSPSIRTARIFHRPQWSRAVERGCGQRAHYLVAERGGALVGCLPLTEVRSPLFGNALVSARASPPAAASSPTAKRSREALAEAGWALAGRHGCARLELRGGPFPEGWTRSATDIYANFARDLPGDGEDPVRSRSRAASAPRSGARRAFDLTTSGRRRPTAIATPITASYAESVPQSRHAGLPARACSRRRSTNSATTPTSSLVWKDGRPLAACSASTSRACCQPYWGGGTARGARLARQRPHLFRADAPRVERGCTRVDFGRSKIGTGAWQLQDGSGGSSETPLRLRRPHRRRRGAARRSTRSAPNTGSRSRPGRSCRSGLANRLGPLIARGLG